MLENKTCWWTWTDKFWTKFTNGHARIHWETSHELPHKDVLKARIQVPWRRYKLMKITDYVLRCLRHQLLRQNTMGAAITFTHQASDPCLSFAASSLCLLTPQPFNILIGFSQSWLEMFDSFSMVQKICHFYFPSGGWFVGNCKTASWFINVSTFSPISSLDKKTSLVMLSVRFS